MSPHSKEPKVRVWSLSSHKKDGSELNLFIIVPRTLQSPEKIHAYAQTYLKSVDEPEAAIDPEYRQEFRMEITPGMLEVISKHDHCILEMDRYPTSYLVIPKEDPE